MPPLATVGYDALHLDRNPSTGRPPMRFQSILAPACMICVAACVSATVSAKQSAFNDKLSVGEKAPDIAGLPGIDGKKHALGEFKDAKAVVVVFTCNHCPVAVAYEDRLAALRKDYAERGVQVVAICSSFEAGNDLEALKQRAQDKHFNFPYLRDDNQNIARAYGATHTPHVFLLNGDRQIAYMGAIDDNETPDKVAKPYLRDALDAVLAGKAPTTTETQPLGCRIRYKRLPRSAR